MARILLVDGDEQFRRLCSKDLEREGHDVVTASTGPDALRGVAERAPDLVITEVHLPGMDGLDLMSRLLASHRQLIVILNSRSSSYTENFLSWAADACLTKHGDTLELLAKVRALLNRRNADLKLGAPAQRQPLPSLREPIRAREMVQH